MAHVHVPRVTYIAVDHADYREYYVRCHMDNDEIDEDGVYPTRTAAEARAEKLARLYACDWGTNYGGE